ncbi:MAG: 50S ribosomal protein L3, partial [Opitutae bacterium]
MIATLLGKKIGMTQVYDAQNVLVPVTVVEAGPCPVVQIKTVESDGYNAVQLGFGVLKAKNASKGEANHAKKAGLESTPRLLNEVRLAETPTVKLGDIITVAIFSEGQ